MSTRLNVNLNDATATALRDVAAKHQITATEAVRRAVSVYQFFNQRQRDGLTIQLADANVVTEVHLS